jgi:ABC-type transport system substrate-binding protein
MRTAVVGRRTSWIAISLVVALLALLLGVPPVMSQGRPVIVAISSDIGSLDTHESTGNPAEIIRRHIYEGLVRLTPQGKIEPLLATSWQVAPDQRTWTFVLRQGVRFQDGTPFTADAVKVNLDRVRDPNQHHLRAAQYRAIESVDVLDPYHVRIVTKTPYSPFLINLAYGGGSFMSPAALTRYGKDIGTHPVGTGPYQFASMDPGVSVDLVRSSQYWGPKPALDRLHFVIVKEASTRLGMLQSGQADVISDVPPQDVTSLRNDPRVGVTTLPSNYVLHLIINMQAPILNDKRVRQALNYGVNRQELSQALLFGYGQPARSVVAPSIIGYADTWHYSYDPARARRLLSEAGYPNGFDVTIATPDGRYPMDKEIAEAIQGQLARIGVRAKVQVMDWGTYLAYLRVPAPQSTAQLSLLADNIPTFDISWLLDFEFNTRNLPPAGFNVEHYSNPQVDQLIDQALATVDDAKRQQLWTKTQQIIADDAPWLLLLVYDQSIGVAKNLTRVQVLPDGTILLMDAKSQ